MLNNIAYDLYISNDYSFVYPLFCWRNFYHYDIFEKKEVSSLQNFIL